MTIRTFPGRYDSLALIAEFVRTEAKKAGLSNKESFELETAVDEAVSNIIEHAYGGEGVGEVTCSCIPDENGITVILEDRGFPFDPSSIPIPNLKAALEDRKNHGLGYFLMCQLTDKVNFKFLEDRNQLTMVKYHKA